MDTLLFMFLFMIIIICILIKYSKDETSKSNLNEDLNGFLFEDLPLLPSGWKWCKVFENNGFYWQILSSGNWNGIYDNRYPFFKKLKTEMNQKMKINRKNRCHL